LLGVDKLASRLLRLLRVDLVVFDEILKLAPADAALGVDLVEHCLDGL
jgi:hypothetical protein